MVVTEHKLKGSTKFYLYSIHKYYACFVKTDSKNPIHCNSAFIGKGGVVFVKAIAFVFCQRNYLL
jgi:hypothetical protein